MEKKFPFFRKLVLLTLLMLGVGSAFGAGDCLETATVWKDCVSQPKDTTIGDVTYKKITTEKELAWLSKNINNNAILLNDLDMNGKLWIPIAAGDGGSKYGKIFDGNHHRISNLYINAEDYINNNNSSYAQNLGFIGSLTGTVKNLIIENISVYGYGRGFLSASVDTEEKPISIGTVVGWQSDNNSLVEGCYVTGKIITSGDGQAVGGIVGNLGGGTITNCVSYTSIDANGKAFVGGIVGYTKDFSKTGASLDVISSCVYAGNSLSSTGTGAVGAIVGYQYKGIVSISDAVYDSDLSVDGEPINGFGATKDGKVNETSNPDLAFLGTQTTSESELNEETIVCALNGRNEDNTCKTEPWEMGETSLSLNGYGADGYKITFDANGGSFSNESTTFIKYVKAGYIINNDGVENPIWDDDHAFAGWTSESTPDAYMNQASKVETIKANWNPVYTITFKSVNGELNGTFPDGSSTPQIVKVEQGKKITVQNFDRPTSFTQNGVKYNFVGWANAVNPDPDNIENYDPNDPQNAYVENGLDDLPEATGDMTLVAVWTTAEVFTVSFFANDESVASYVSSVYENDKATAWTADRAGYTFAGWFENENLEGDAFDFNQVITQNYNLYAKWKQNSYNINYVMNCSDECVNSNAGQYTVYGLNLSNPTWDDAHQFKGWFTDAAFKNKVESISAGTTDDLTLYAEWETIVYEITYRAGQFGNGTVDPEYKTHGVNYTIRGNAYTRQGYTQTGWATSDNGVKEYDFGAVYSANAPLTLYPTWAQVYTITYSAGANGSGTIASAQKIQDKAIRLSSTTFTREGWQQDGWSTKANGAKNYELGGIYSANADVTLYPHWVQNLTVTQYGAVTINDYGDHKEAVIDGDYGAKTKTNERDAVAIPEGGIGVNRVVMSRIFPVNVYSTIVLPFSVNTANVSGLKAVLYYNGIKTENKKSTIRMKVLWAEDGYIPDVQYSHTNMLANTPYLLLMKDETFAITGVSSITLEATLPAETPKDNWTFRGVWKYKEWGPKQEDSPENYDSETGYAYGFSAAASGDKINVGDFVRVGEGAWIRPMRAYLVRDDKKPQLARANGAYVKRPSVVQEELPEIMSIVIDNGRDDEEQTTVIGHFNTRTGEIKMIPQNRTFDIKGRNVGNKANKARGAYYGKKVLKK